MSVLEEITAQVFSGEHLSVGDLVQQALDQGLSPKEVLEQGVVAAMAQVGQRWEAGEFYLPEVLKASRAAQAGLKVLSPHLSKDADLTKSKVVLGTIQGDMHDIGKKLVGMVLEGAGFTVIDLGIDVDPQKFVDAVKEHEARIIAVSALLTTTMINIIELIKRLKEAGIRDQVKIMVGGAPLTTEFAEKAGADAYGKDCFAAVALAEKF
ncbi:B12-binding domain-containing protein [Thermodesulfobacteriota bacterium]